jgi:hypothetical protein
VTGNAKGVAGWRIVGAVAILGILAFVLAVCSPYYFRNMKLQSFVAGLTRGTEVHQQSDTGIRSTVVEKAEQLGLPVVADNVRITREQDGTVKKIDVRYMVPIDFPGYTVKLHFYPGAGSR